MSGSDAHRLRLRRPPRAVLAGCAALLTVALAVGGPGGAWAAFTGTTVSPGNQLATRTAFPDYRTAVQNNGPVVHHPFDDAYGSATAAALAGTTGTYHRAAAPSRATSTAIAASTGAVRFPAGTYAAADTTTSLSGAAVNTVPLTLEAWVRTGTGGAVVSLLPEASTTTSGRTQLYVNALGQACVGLVLESPLRMQEVCGFDDTDPKVWTAADQTSPVWHHIAAVINPGGAQGTQINVYVDGRLAYDDGLLATWPQSLAGRVRVGTAPIPTDVMGRAAPDTFSGDVDEVAVYAGALSAAEIKKHYDLGKGTVAGDYAATVKATSSLHLYWRLDGAPGAGTGRNIADASAQGLTGTHHSYPDLQADGAPTGTSTPGTAVGLSGLDDVSTGASRTTPAAFSTEIWFRSSGGTGPLISFGATTSPDRAVYLTADGRLAFTMLQPTQRTLTTDQRYSDDRWHLVTATVSDAGLMRLYVDGASVGERPPAGAAGSSPGLWRWGGGGSYSAFGTKPGAAFFTGRLDEASVYDRELSAEEVAIHWGAGF